MESRKSIFLDFVLPLLVYNQEGQIRPFLGEDDVGDLHDRLQLRAVHRRAKVVMTEKIRKRWESGVARGLLNLLRGNMRSFAEPQTDISELMNFSEELLRRPATIFEGQDTRPILDKMHFLLTAQRHMDQQQWLQRCVLAGAQVRQVRCLRNRRNAAEPTPQQDVDKLQTCGACGCTILLWVWFFRYATGTSDTFWSEVIAVWIGLAFIVGADQTLDTSICPQCSPLIRWILYGALILCVCWICWVMWDPFFLAVAAYCKGQRHSDSAWKEKSTVQFIIFLYAKYLLMLCKALPIPCYMWDNMIGLFLSSYHDCPATMLTTTALPVGEDVLIV